MWAFGCAATCHSSQGATAARVLVHVDTEQAHDQLVNSRLAHVLVPRGRGQSCPVSRIPCPGAYTNDAQKLGEELCREVSKQSALETEHEMSGRDHILPIRGISGALHSRLGYT